MASVNTFILSGTVRAQAESKQYGATSVVKLPLTVEEERKGTVHQAPVEVTLFGQTASAALSLAVGTQVVVQGKISVRQYEKNGEPKSFTDLVGFAVQAFGGGDASLPPF